MSQDEKLLRHLAALAKRYGLTVWQWLPGPVGQHAAGSYHYKTFPGSKTGRAFDAYGPELRMKLYAWHLRLFYRRKLTEGIFNTGGPSRNLSVKFGRNVPASWWGAQTWEQHRNHVHVAR